MAHAGEPATVQPDRQLPTQATSDNGPSSTLAAIHSNAVIDPT